MSLVVATVGRQAELRRLFDSLANQTSGNFEVIVVDQGHAGSTAQIVVNEFAARLDITYIHDDGVGLSRARNKGLPHAKGSHLGFPDDDCWYAPGLIADVFEQFARFPGTGILSGIYTEPGKPNPAFASAASPLSLWNVFGRTCSVGLFLDRDALKGCSVSFDERIGAGTNLPVAEEIDLVLRLMQADVRGYFDPHLVVYHQIVREKTGRKADFVATRRAFWYVIGKNYPFPLNALRFFRGVAGVVLTKSPYGIGCALSALVSGMRAGMSQRHRMRIVD